MPWEETPASEDAVLIDTSMWVEALDPGGDPACQQKVSELVTGGRAATCEIVVAEILRGAASDAEAEELEEQLRGVPRLSMEGAGAVAAAMGRQMGAPRQRLADLLIAAIAFVNDVALLHRDHHLAQVAERFHIPQTPV